MPERCDECGGRFDRPGLFQCDDSRHPTPDLAQRVVATIERDLRDRRGLRQAFETINDDIQDQIRDRWADLIRAEIALP